MTEEAKIDPAHEPDIDIMPPTGEKKVSRTSQRSTWLLEYENQICTMVMFLFVISGWLNMVSGITTSDALTYGFDRISTHTSAQVAAMGTFCLSWIMCCFIVIYVHRARFEAYREYGMETHAITGPLRLSALMCILPIFFSIAVGCWFKYVESGYTVPFIIFGDFKKSMGFLYTDSSMDGYQFDPATTDETYIKPLIPWYMLEILRALGEFGFCGWVVICADTRKAADSEPLRGAWLAKIICGFAGSVIVMIRVLYMFEIQALMNETPYSLKMKSGVVKDMIIAEKSKALKADNLHEFSSSKVEVVVLRRIVVPAMQALVFGVISTMVPLIHKGGVMPMEPYSEKRMRERRGGHIAVLIQGLFAVASFFYIFAGLVTSGAIDDAFEGRDLCNEDCERTVRGFTFLGCAFWCIFVLVVGRLYAKLEWSHLFLANISLFVIYSFIYIFAGLVAIAGRVLNDKDIKYYENSLTQAQRNEAAMKQAWFSYSGAMTVFTFWYGFAAIANVVGILWQLEFSKALIFTKSNMLRIVVRVVAFALGPALYCSAMSNWYEHMEAGYGVPTKVKITPGCIWGKDSAGRSIHDMEMTRLLGEFMFVIWMIFLADIRPRDTIKPLTKGWRRAIVAGFVILVSRALWMKELDAKCATDMSMVLSPETEELVPDWWDKLNHFYKAESLWVVLPALVIPSMMALIFGVATSIAAQIYVMVPRVRKEKQTQFWEEEQKPQMDPTFEEEKPAQESESESEDEDEEPAQIVAAKAQFEEQRV